MEQLERDTLASELRELRQITGFRGAKLALLTEDEFDGLLTLHHQATQEYQKGEVVQGEHGREVRFVEMSPAEKADFQEVRQEAAQELESALRRVRNRLAP